MTTRLACAALTRWLCAALISVTLALPSAAQSEWRERPTGASVSYDALVPLERTGAGWISAVGPSVYFESSRLLSGHVLSARVPVSGRVALIGELPVAYRDFDISAEQEERHERLRQGSAGGGQIRIILSQTQSEFGVGNPMLGAQIAVAERTTVEVSARLPVGGRRDGGLEATALNPAEMLGRIADPEHIEAYATGVASLSLGVHRQRRLGRSLHLDGAATVVASALHPDLAATSRQFSKPTTNLALVWRGALHGDAGPLRLSLDAVGRIDPRVGWVRVGTLRAGARAALTRGPVRPSLLVGTRTVSLGVDVPLW